jgi:hypothetical protein
MEGIFDSGLTWIMALQQGQDSALTSFFRAITFMGEEMFCLLFFLIGLSRVMLGVHFPHQIVVGWLVGAILLVLYLWLGPQAEHWLARLRLETQLVVTLCLPAIIALPFVSDATMSAMRVLAGFGSGFVLTRQYVHFSAEGAWWHRLARYLVGLPGLLAFYLGLQAISPKETSAYFHVFRFLRCSAAGIWISFGAPWLFTRMRISQHVSTQPGLQMWNLARAAGVREGKPC